MGPFDLDRQLDRRRAVRKLLSNPDLPKSTRRTWYRIYQTITLDEAEYNRRVRETYANHTQELVEWNP